MKLLLNALTKFLSGILLVGSCLFFSAGNLSYANAWLLIALLFCPIFILGVFLFFKNPELLKKRLNNKEKEKTQKYVVLFSGILFVGGFIIAGLDYRFGWSHIPTWLTIIASFSLLISYILYAEVLRENTFLSRTIEVQENQTVIDSGLYQIVRHPMYTSTLFLFFSIPIVLGSWWSFLCFFPYLIILIVRIQNEEKFLTAELQGYSEYKKRVKYRLIPFIW